MKINQGKIKNNSSGMKVGKNSKAAKWSMVSAIAACVSAIIASTALVFAVFNYINISNQNKALILAVPALVKQVSHDKIKINIIYTNFGKNPARGFTGNMKIFSAIDKDPEIFEHEIYADYYLPPGMEVIQEQDFKFKNNMEKQYILIQAVYVDAINNESYTSKQFFYLKGIKNNSIIDEKIFNAKKEDQVKMMTILKLDNKEGA